MIEKHWKGILALIGVAEVVDLLKEFLRHEAMNWFAEKLGPLGAWIVLNPTAILTLAIISILISLLVVALRDLSQPLPSRILDHTEQPYSTPVSARWIIGFASVIVICAFFVAYGSYRYYQRPNAPPAPLAPTGLSSYPQSVVSFSDELVTVRTQSGSPGPCDSKGSKPFRSIEELPGGRDYKKPYLVIEPKALVRRYPNTGDDAKVFVDMVVVNRGETSIAKDWKFCLASEGKAYWYSASDVTPDDITSLNPLKSLPEFGSQPIGHGNVTRGWLLFHVPMGLIFASQIEGSIKCRDYLEHESETLFGSEDHSPKK